MKALVSFLLVFGFSLFQANHIAAQTFGANIQGALVVSQIDGDASAGYNRTGPALTFNGYARLYDNMKLQIGISYCQRGSRSELIPGNFDGILRINLNYVEVPLTFHYMDWLDDGSTFYRMDFFGGLYGARLLSSSEEFSGYADLLEDFNKTEIGLTLGMGFNFTRHSGVGFKWSRALNRLYDNDGNSANQNSLNNRFIHIYYQYTF